MLKSQLAGFDPRILRHSGILGAADETVLNKVPKFFVGTQISIKFSCIFFPKIVYDLTWTYLFSPSVFAYSVTEQ